MGNKARVDVYPGKANLRDLAKADLRGAHLHFYGEFNLQDLTHLDLRNATLIFNNQNLEDARGESTSDEHSILTNFSLTLSSAPCKPYRQSTTNCRQQDSATE